MEPEFIYTIIDLISQTGGAVPVEYKKLGTYVMPLRSDGFIGGELNRIFTDELGRIQSASINMASILGCGHLVTKASEIAGYCQICGKVCCNLYPGCLMVCDFKGITVCRKHYKYIDGVVVSTAAQKGLWRLKAKSLANKRRNITDEAEKRAHQTEAK